jgi:hypothetical protein
MVVKTTIALVQSLSPCWYFQYVNDCIRKTPLVVSFELERQGEPSLQHESIDWHLGEHAGEGEMLDVSLVQCQDSAETTYRDRSQGSSSDILGELCS